MLTRRTVNILMLSFGFMFLFISFQTMANILLIVLNSVKIDYPSYDADGTLSLAIVYVVLSFSNFIAPSVLSVLGTRPSMVVGAITYAIYIGSFHAVYPWVLYFVSAVIGIGAAVIWTAQGTYLTQNSDNITIGRNAGIFWATFQCSQLIGNFFVYVTFQGKERIDEGTRNYLYTVLCGVSIMGIIILIFLRPPLNVEGDEIADSSDGPLVAMKRSFSLLGDVKMMYLFLSFCYTGVLLSFAGSIYNPCIGFTKSLASDPKPLVGLGGVLFGIGEVLGGSVFGTLGSKTVVWGRNPVIIVGCFVSLASFALIFLNIPNNAFFGETHDISYFSPPLVSVALLCSFLLGFGDSCFNTQIYSIIGTLYREDSAPSFAMFKFAQSMSSALAFFFFKYLMGLHNLLRLLSVMVLLATLTFFGAERIAVKTNTGSATSEETSTRTNID